MPKYKFIDIAFNSTEKKKPTEEDKYTYIGLEHLDSGTLTVSRWGSVIAPIGEKLVMKKGDVLFGKRRAYQKKVGIAPFDGIFSAHGMVLRPREEVITKEYFPLFISSDYFLNEAIRISVGSLSPTINWKDLKDLEFSIPTIDEQRRLTPLIWAAIDAKNAYKSLITQTDDLVKSQFIEMFGDPITNTQNRPVVRLDTVVTLQRGFDLPNTQRHEDGAIPIYGSNGLLGHHDSSMAKDGVVTGRSGTIGQVYCVHGAYWPLNTALFSIDTHGNNIDYLAYFLRYFDLTRFYNGTGVPTLNRNDVHKELVYTVPIDEQERFVRIAEQSDKSKFVGANRSNRNLSRCFSRADILPWRLERS